MSRAKGKDDESRCPYSGSVDQGWKCGMLDCPVHGSKAKFTEENINRAVSRAQAETQRKSNLDLLEIMWRLPYPRT